MAEGVDALENAFGCGRLPGEVGVQRIFVAQFDDIKGLDLGAVLPAYAAGHAHSLFADFGVWSVTGTIIFFAAKAVTQWSFWTITLGLAPVEWRALSV